MDKKRKSFFFTQLFNGKKGDEVVENGKQNEKPS